MIGKYSEENQFLQESYRNIRTLLNLNENLKVIQVSSAQVGEGKTTVAANLARCFSEIENNKVLLIDCNLRNSGIKNQFEIGNFKGLTDIILKKEDIEECMNHEDNLDIIIDGTIKSNSAQILQSEDMKNFMLMIRDKYDYIFVDSPTLSLVNDGYIISKYSDGMIIVCSSNESEIQLAKTTKVKLKKLNINIIGVILNKLKKDDDIYHDNYDIYGKKQKKLKLLKLKKEKQKKLGFANRGILSWR